MSTPRCVSGSAAMKMMSSTSRTSMSGVTFMSHATESSRLRGASASSSSKSS